MPRLRARPRTRDPAAKRRRISRAALDLFARHGYDATSVAAVAEAAGVSEGLVFHHFGSKEGLLEACGAEAVRPLVEDLLQDAEEAGPLDYHHMLDATFAFVARDASIGRLWARPDERLTTPLTRGLRAALLTPLTALLRREQRAGRARSGDPALLARFQFAIVGEALFAHFRGETALSRKRVVEEVARSAAAVAAPDPRRR